MPVPVMLAIETSQRVGSVAVRDSAGAVNVEPLRQTKRHDDDLMPAIDRLVQRSGLTPRDLDAVAVSIGPGGFTGLRIAVSAAKIFGETLAATLIGVPSTLVAAESCDLPAGPIAMALASKRTSFWLTLVDRAGPDEPWVIRGEPGICESASLDLAGVQMVLADRYLPELARSRCEEAGVPVVEPVFDAAACLRVGGRMLEGGLVTDPLALRPIYPRPPEAVVIWDQRS